VKPETQLLVKLGLIHRDGEWFPYWDGWIGWMREPPCCMDPARIQQNQVLAGINKF
jgi:hypothetical protein